MINVLEVFGEPISYGGQESFFFNVFRHMDLSDLKIDLFTPYYCDNSSSKDELEQSGGKLISLNLPFEPGKSRLNIYKPLLSYLKNNHYDVVHIHSGSTSVLALAALAARRNGVRKIIVHSHCTGIRKNLKYRLTKLLMTPILDTCPTDYCACSKEAGEWKFSARAMKKLVILKNGVDLERFGFSSKIREQTRNSLGIRSDDYVIGHVGRFTYQKNQEFIIDLLRAVKPDIPHVKALLIGTGDTMDQIRSRAKEYGLDGDVLFIGNVDNTQDYYQAMDVFVFPSRFEGLGIVGVEAQANGLTVFASTEVPQELKISSLVKFISLEDIQMWKKEIIKVANKGRLDVSGQIRLAGYDIRETAAQLQKIYLSNN